MFVALLTGPASNIHSTALSLGRLPLTFYNVSFDPRRKKDPRSGPYKSMTVGCSLSQHRVGFTNVSFNNGLVTLYKVLEVHPDN